MTSMANDDDQKPLTLYSDMVGDLFHFGHVLLKRRPGRSWRRSAQGFRTHRGGLVGDKRPRIQTQANTVVDRRAGLVRELSLVDEVIEDCPLVTSAAFMDKHGIDFVAHGDDYDPESQTKYTTGTW